MKRCLSAIAATLLLALAGGVANAYADAPLGAPALGQENAVQSVPSTILPQQNTAPAPGQSQANNAGSEQDSAVLGVANLQTGLNNNTFQAGEQKTDVLTVSRAPSVDGYESNGNTNTVGDQTAVNGNNFQQSNEQTESNSRQRSGGACCIRDDSNEAGQENGARNEQSSFVAKAANVQTGLNNNTVQLGEDNRSDGNTNTVGDQTAVNGNNFQQSNEQTGSSKSSWRRDDWKRDDCHSGCKPKKPRCECQRPESRGSAPSQSNTTDGGWKQDDCRCHEDGNRQGSIVLGGLNVQTGLNNNTVQLGSDNESNGNTNTVGDQTAVNGNNAQQSNESNNGAEGDQENSARNDQGAILLGAANIQTGLNNNTVQLGSGNESNHNTNTAGDQTAVNGNNFQQSNEQTGSAKGDWKDGSWKGDECHSSCEPKPRCEPKPKCPDHSGQGAQPAGQSNRASNQQGAIVIGGLNVQTGLNNNTVQLGSGNESNGNTNTVGDQTAVNGNNFQQSNESRESTRGENDGWKGGRGDWKRDNCHSGCKPRPQHCEPRPKPKCEPKPKPRPKRCKPEPKCEPKPKCPDEKKRPEHGSRPEHDSSPAEQQNTAVNRQGAIVLGGLNVQTGLNNNTVQLGSGNESNHNTNTVGDQTAVNGNNFQQTNTRSFA
jgi:hypothetical protein